jgi:hypothetical protein
VGILVMDVISATDGPSIIAEIDAAEPIVLPMMLYALIFNGIVIVNTLVRAEPGIAIDAKFTGLDVTLPFVIFDAGMDVSDVLIMELPLLSLEVY